MCVVKVVGNARVCLEEILRQSAGRNEQVAQETLFHVSAAVNVLYVNIILHVSAAVGVSYVNIILHVSAAVGVSYVKIILHVSAAVCVIC